MTLNLCVLISQSHVKNVLKFLWLFLTFCGAIMILLKLVSINIP